MGSSPLEGEARWGLFGEKFCVNKNMKKYLIIFVALAILAPATAQAFSFTDVVNFGRWLIHREAKPAAVEVKKEAAVPDKFSILTAENKYQNWKAAFEKKDVSLAIVDSRNLYFTDAEINYLVSKELAAMSDPAVRDAQISFTENLIKISGYAILKNFDGQFSLEAKVVEANNRIGFQVTKVRYRNFYFPAFIVQSLLDKEVKEMIDFLYSSPSFQNLSATVGNGFIELNYKNKNLFTPKQ
jgi:hypothetical protein